MTPAPLLPPEGPAERIANVLQSLVFLRTTHRDAAVVCVPRRWLERWEQHLQEALTQLREAPSGE